MILEAVILAAGVLAGVNLLITYWNNITSWLKRTIEAIKSVLNGVFVGVQIFVRKIKEGIREIAKCFSKEQNRWMETIKIRGVPQSEVPLEILQKAKTTDDVDISEDYELALKNG